MDTTTGIDELSPVRRQVHAMWASVADGWREHADDADARGAALTTAMLDRAGIRRGDRVLELASGPGGLGLAAAARLGPEDEVVVSDVVPEMVTIAAARARERGLTNVRTAVLDLEAIDEPDESVDVVVCREGLMFATEPLRAAREIRRVLRPGGRLAVAVWGPRDQNPWLGLVFDAVAAQLGQPFPPPGVPGPFALDDTGTVTRLLAAATLVDIAVVEVPVPLHAATFDEWWSRTRALAGPLATIVASLPDPTRDAIVERLRDAIARYRTSDGITIPGVSLLATARRAPEQSRGG
jgi:SAM-dependent methyltransferase